MFVLNVSILMFPAVRHDVEVERIMLTINALIWTLEAVSLCPLNERSPHSLTAVYHMYVCLIKTLTV